MKKTKFWFLGIILALIYSCSDDFDAVEESPQDFGISEAQSYFETNATDLAPLMFSNPLARSTNLVMPELIPEWDKAIESIEDDYQITEIPLWSQPNVICVESIIKDYEFFAENSISCGRRLVIARGSDGKTDMFVATLIPDEKYSKNPEGAFTGRVLYSELNGKFRKAVRYKNGELEGDLLIVGAYGFAIQTEKDVPTGYSKLTFMEGNPVLRAATYSNSESGGGSWGGGGGGGGNPSVTSSTVGGEGGTSVEAEPAEPQEAGTHGDQRQVVGYGRFAGLHVVTPSEENDRGKRRKTGADVDHDTARKVHYADLGEEAAAPNPVRLNGVDQCRDHSRIDAVGQEFRSFRHSTGYDGSCSGTEHQVKHKVRPVKRCIAGKDIKARFAD